MHVCMYRCMYRLLPHHTAFHHPTTIPPHTTPLTLAIPHDTYLYLPSQKNLISILKFLCGGRLDDLRRGLTDLASTSSGEARSLRHRRPSTRLDRPSLDELRRGSIGPGSTAFDEARPARLRRTSMRKNVQLIDDLIFVRAVTFWQHRPPMPQI